MKFRSLVVAGVALSALAAAPAAMATDQTVSAVGGDSISINAATNVIFGSLFTAGNDFTGTGTVTAVSTSPTWTLNVKDGSGTGADGHMHAVDGADLTGLQGILTTVPNTSTCSSSESELASAATVTGSGVPVVGNATGHVVTLSTTDQAVANATTGVLPLTAITTTIGQHVASTERLQTGCLYKITATYTISAS